MTNNPKIMNPEIKAAWVKALRSGAYDQGMGSLKAGHPGSAAFCCLGVLCELAADAGVIPKGLRKEDEPNNRVYYFVGEDEFLPSEVMQWANLDSNNGSFNDGFGDTCLTDLNDNGKSFSALAEIIDRHF